MLYSEKMKAILTKFGVDIANLPDNLYSTLLDAISECEKTTIINQLGDGVSELIRAVTLDADSASGLDITLTKEEMKSYDYILFKCDVTFNQYCRLAIDGAYVSSSDEDFNNNPCGLIMGYIYEQNNIFVTSLSGNFIYIDANDTYNVHSQSNSATMLAGSKVSIYGINLE